MPRFRCYGKVCGTKYLGEFEAATREEAKELAYESEAADISFCHNCEDTEVVEVFVEKVNNDKK